MPAKTVTIRVAKPKSSKALTAERVRKWEAREGRSFEDTVDAMFRVMLAYINDNPTHFCREIERSQKDHIYFVKQVRLGLSDSLHEYVDFNLGYSESQEKKEALEWHLLSDTFKEINLLLGRLPKQKIEAVSSRLEASGFSKINENIRPAIKKALLISLSKKYSFEFRGNKRSSVSILAVELFENLEYRLKRSLARSFALVTEKQKMRLPDDERNNREFVGLDAELIYRIVRTVKPNAVKGTVQNALKSMPSRKSENK